MPWNGGLSGRENVVGPNEYLRHVVHTCSSSPANLDQGTGRLNIATLSFLRNVAACRCLSLAASFVSLACTLARSSSVTSLSSKQPSWKASSSRHHFFSCQLPQRGASSSANQPRCAQPPSVSAAVVFPCPTWGPSCSGPVFGGQPSAKPNASVGAIIMGNGANMAIMCLWGAS